MSETNALPSVSFIIPHRGRIDFLKQTLESIQLQNYDLSKIDIIIITQDEIEKIKPASECINLNLSVIHVDPSLSISSLRNTGARISNSSFLAFIDADIYLSNNWIIKMLHSFNDNQNIICVSSIQTENTNPTNIEKIRTKLSCCSKAGYVESLPGANLFLARQTFNKTSGFPENLITCEDIFFTSSLNSMGKLLITDEASFIHLGEDKTYKHVLKKEYWRAKSNLLSLKNRKTPLRELPSILLPFWFISAIFISIYSIIFITLDVLILSIAAYFLPIFLYAFRATLKNRISFYHNLIFYFIYHTARTFGTFSGFFNRTNRMREK